MTTITLPFYDETGKLTPLIVAAMANGATSDHGEEADTIVLTFADEADPAIEQLKALVAPAPEAAPAKRKR